MNQLPPIVGVSWLLDNYGDVVVVDCRAYLDEREGIDAYNAGHLPGARFVDLETQLSAVGDPVNGRHPLPNPVDFANVLGELGIGASDSVVVYDDAGGMIAGRLVWMLRTIGQAAAVLDGGIQAWTGQLTTDPSDHRRERRIPSVWPDGAFVSADDVANHIADGGVVVDVRGPDRYAGKVEPIDARAGHIPGARNIPFATNMQEGRYLGMDELREKYQDAGVDDQTIVYCGSGVSACHTLLAVEAAGLGRPRLFVGSWSGWSSDPDRPVATET